MNYEKQKEDLIEFIEENNGPMILIAVDNHGCGVVLHANSKDRKFNDNIKYRYEKLMHNLLLFYNDKDIEGYTIEE